MAIKTVDLGNGTIRTFSTTHMMIERDGVRYSEAIDPVGSERVYIETDEMIDDYVPVKYSTLSIKRELARIGKWAVTKSLLEAYGCWDDYVLANYLSEQDEVFQKACSELVVRGVMTQVELDALLPKCIWKAE